MSKYIILCSKNWFLESIDNRKFSSKNYEFITKKKDLSLERLKEFGPEYLFFVHWNWMVPPKIHKNYECVVFHTAPLPVGRGGSPIQNLIKRGYTKTPVCALRMNNELDGGPIYCNREISLSGSAEDIFSRISIAIQEMIFQIIKSHPIPIEQEGEPLYFSRRTPEMSKIPKDLTVNELYDHIRMLDADSYPNAYIEYGDFIIKFKKAKSINSKELSAEVHIKIK